MSSINYDLKKIRAIAFDVDGVLSPSTIPLSSEGEPLRMVNVKDGYALQHAIKRGYKLAIITGASTMAIHEQYQNLGIHDIYMGASKKLPILKAWMQKYGLLPEEVVYMGDDIPDLPVLRSVGLSCCPYDAVWEVKQTVNWISKYTGGYGCVRDLLEQIMKVNNDWLNDDDAFGW